MHAGIAKKCLLTPHKINSGISPVFFLIWLQYSIVDDIPLQCGGPEKALDYKDKGNQQYAQQKYADAVKLYTDAIKSE